MRRSVIVVLVLMAVRGVSQCRNGASGWNRYVSITLSNGLGGPAENNSYAVREFKNLNSQKDYSTSFGLDAKMGPFTVEHVPFGTYRIRVKSLSGSEEFGRLIDVCEKDMTVEVPDRFAQVRIVLLNASIDSVTEVHTVAEKVESFRNLDGTEMKSLFKGDEADEVPYGSYDLVLFNPLGEPVNRRVDVFQDNVWLFSGLSIEVGDRLHSGPENVVRGEVENIPQNERPVFVTMSGVFVPYTINGAVPDSGSRSGTFVLNGANPRGVFMLYTIGRSGILDSREIKVPRESSVVIDLSHPNPPKIDAP